MVPKWRCSVPQTCLGVPRSAWQMAGQDERRLGNRHPQAYPAWPATDHTAVAGDRCGDVRSGLGNRGAYCFPVARARISPSVYSPGTGSRSRLATKSDRGAPGQAGAGPPVLRWAVIYSRWRASCFQLQYRCLHTWPLLGQPARAGEDRGRAGGSHVGLRLRPAFGLGVEQRSGCGPV